MMEEDWFLYSVTLFTFIVIFALCYIRHIFTFFERNKMSSASSPSFPFGNIYDVVFQKTPMFMQLWKYYNRFKKKVCRFGGFYVFLKPAILIVDPQLTKTILSASNEYFQELEEDKFSNLNGELCDKILSNVFKKLLHSWSTITENFRNEEVNLSSIMDQYVIESSARGFFYLKESKENHNQSIKYILEQNGFSNFHRLFSISYPQIYHLLHMSNNKHVNFCEVFLENIINNRKKNDVREDDVLQVLIENNFSVGKMVKLINNLIHNLKISTDLVLLVLYELSLNKDIQEDLRGEILRFRKNKTITFSMLHELSYLETLICETFRKYPLKPLVQKVCKADYVGNDIKFSKGLLLFVSIFGIHHDAQNYINPEQFDPDRFSEENENFIDPIKYLPFGSGKKGDFDSLYISLIMKLTLVELLSKFKFSLSKKSLKSLRFDEASFELKPKDEIWLKIEKL